MKKHLFLGSLLALSVATAAMADLQKGLEFYKYQHYDMAYTEFQTAAEAGDNIALYYLGLMHQKGQGVPQNKMRAAQFFLDSYNAGNTLAATKLAVMLLNNDGVEKDTRTALELLRSAGRAGEKEALYTLGELYAQGDPVEQNYVYAAGFYKLSALQGFAPAQYKLATLYLYGRGIPQDHQMAVTWFTRAAQQGYVQAQYDLATLSLMEGRLKNIGRAYIWFSIVAAYNTDEIGVEAAKHRDEAAQLVKKAVDLDIMQEAVRKWVVRQPQETVPPEELTAPTPTIPGFNDEATLATLQGSSLMQLSSGSAYAINSDEIEKAILTRDVSAIEEKINQWGSSGHPDAYLYWGKLVEVRLQDKQTAMQWYLKAAEAGNAEAQYRVAQGYCEGEQFPLNPSECYMWLKEAEKTAKGQLRLLVDQTLQAVESQMAPEDIQAGLKKQENRQQPKKEEEPSNSIFNNLFS
ncbi:MAG: sel1 repeat family protein [Alphaproteobacteria bacterium]|nr:sel1 repeat family protein [Alphaproteobacteria bacterium]